MSCAASRPPAQPKVAHLTGFSVPLIPNTRIHQPPAWEHRKTQQKRFNRFRSHVQWAGSRLRIPLLFFTHGEGWRHAGGVLGRYEQ